MTTKQKSAAKADEKQKRNSTETAESAKKTKKATASKTRVKKTEAKVKPTKASPLKDEAPKSKAVKKTRTGASAVGKTLVIVESPSKAKTLSGILGSKYVVRSSVGHIRDLPRSRMAIDIENNFTPEYILVKGKAAIKNELAALSKSAQQVLLASDPDREGEAIAWHLAELLGLSLEEKCRVRFYEITTNAVRKAVENPDVVDLHKVDAQQARRILDRLVGYTLSPLLWNKIRYGLSAGRVQSVALDLVCEREREIADFVPDEYWNITVLASAADGRNYEMKVDKLDGKTLWKNSLLFHIKDSSMADMLLEEVRNNPIVIS